MAQISEQAKKGMANQPTLKFKLKLPRSIGNMFKLGTGGPKEFVANENENIETTIKKVVQFDDIANYHYFTEQLKGHAGQQAVVLPSLFCGWLEDGALVRAVKNNRHVTPKKHTDTTFSGQSLFYLETKERKYHEGMTLQDYKSFEGADICVSAEQGQSILEAMKSDERLIKVNRFQLSYEEDGRSINTTELASEYKDKVFKVRVLKLYDEAAPTGQQTAASEKLPHSPNLYMSLQNVRLSDSLTEEMRKRMVEDVKLKAHCTLLNPKSRNREDNQKSLEIHRLAKREFAKHLPLKRPSRLLPKWNRYRKSIGCVVFLRAQGTCFLIGENMVITNAHVVMQINQAREIYHNEAIKIYFDYYTPHRFGTSDNTSVEVEVDESEGFLGNLQFDYAILKLKEHQTLEKRRPLGHFVRNFVPDNGLVTIMGHPNGEEQVEETCVIVPADNWCEDLHNRVNDSIGQPGLYVYNGGKLPEEYKDKLAYDTSMFDGASGSPVFDNEGYLIAMHTLGWLLDGVQSMMEFGVIFKAIVEDIRQIKGEEFAAKLFPNYKKNWNTSETSMEVD